MRVLYVGDVMGKAGRNTLSEVLPNLKKELDVDFVIVQAENSNDNGKGPRQQDLEEMRKAGADFFTGGNHSFSSDKTDVLYDDENSGLIRPANIEGKPGLGYKIVDFKGKKILICSVLGQTVGSQKLDVTNPLHKIDEILQSEEDNYDISITNFHGDFSSEKRVFGYYLDGKVTAVIGDHWHVPTADASILPGGTAHITDVGMCGSLHSSLGVKTSVIVDRWRHGKAVKNEMDEDRPYQFNALLIETDEDTGLASEVEHIQRII